MSTYFFVDVVPRILSLRVVLVILTLCLRTLNGTNERILVTAAVAPILLEPRDFHRD
jgi:hypothetical protein